jgi:hypothetical protein
MTGISFYLQVTAFFLAVVVIEEFSWNFWQHMGDSQASLSNPNVNNLENFN